MATRDRGSKAIGALLLLAGMAVFGSATPISKLVGQDFPIFSASFGRVALGALTLLPFVLTDLGAIKKIGKRDWMYIGLIALFGMVGFTILLIYGMKFISGVAGGLIMSFTPALTAIGAYFFMNSPLTKLKMLAIGLGVGGLILINVFRGKFGDTDGPQFYLGVALVLGAITCEAAYTLLGKKATDDVPPVLTSFLACVLALPLFFGLAFIDFQDLQFSETSASAWAALAWWGVGTLGLGSALWYSGVSRASGTTAAGFMAVMPATAILLSYVLLDEKFQPVHGVGIALVMASVGIMSWVHMQHGKESNDTS